jgi:NADPH2:quinone reductase
VSNHGAPAGGFAIIDRDDAERRGITVRGIADLQLQPGQREPIVTAMLARASSGAIRPVIGQVFALADAADAHRAIESRTAVAKTLLRLH